MTATEHWWQHDTNQGWHYYQLRDGLVINEMINKLREVMRIVHETDFLIISDIEFYMYAFDSKESNRLVCTYHFKRCIEP